MSAATSQSRAAAWWQLLRAGNVFTAASNVVAGFLIVQHQWQPAHVLAALIAASTLLYLAGMVLNDVYDVELDAVERPERPIPSGRISRSAAAPVGWALLAAGVGCAWTATWITAHVIPGLIGSLLAAAVVQYNRELKTTAIGPLIMGLCRTLNVLLGVSVASDLAEHGIAVAYAAGMGLYTIGVTKLAQTETTGSLAYRLQVRGVVTWLLRGFIVIDAIAATFAAGWPSGLAVLSLLVPALVASRWAPMT